MNKLLIVLVVLGTLSAVLGATSSSASSSAASASAGKRWKARTITTTRGAQLLRLRSVEGSKSNFTFQAFVVSAPRQTDLRIRSTYGAGSKDDGSGDRASTSFRMRFLSLIEFTDTDNDKMFTRGTDTVVSSYRIGRETSGLWQVSDWTVPTDTATGVYSASVSTPDNVFKVQLAASASEQTLDDGTIVPPTQIKWSGVIKYPFKQTNTRLAFVARIDNVARGVQTSVADGVKSKTVTRQINFGSKSSFAWADTVTVADAAGAKTTANVLVSPLVFNTTSSSLSSDPVTGDDKPDADPDTDSTGEIPTIVVFNFDAVNPVTVTWDPTIGADPSLDTETTVSGSSASSVIVSAFALVFAAIAAFVF